MAETFPRICVLIPVWKDQVGLDSTLATLASETVPFDIIVVDDGSPTPITCGPQYGSHPVVLRRLVRNQGIEHALNAGLELILERGYDYIARLDCGDLPLPGRLERQIAFLDEHPEVGVVGTWARCVDDDGRYLYTLRFPVEHDAMVRMQRYLPALLHPSVMIRAEALRVAGLYRDNYRTAEDYDLWVRISRHYKLANIPEALTEYIVSVTGTTTSKRRRNLTSRLQIQKANFGWTDPHAYLGVGRTLAFMVVPFSWLNAVKQRLWK